MMSRRVLALAFALSTSVAAAQSVQQQAKTDPVHKKVLTLADYGRWNRITGAALSSDGKWMTYTHTPNDGDATLFIKELDGTRLYTVPVGSGAQFSDNGRWVGYFVSPAATSGRGGRGGNGRGNAPPAQTPPVGGRGGAADAAPNRTFELLDLTTGNKTTSAGIASFRFASGSRWLALSANRPAGVTTGGVTVVVRDLNDGGVEQSFGNVGEYQFDDAATLIAYSVDAPDKLANGIYVYDLEKNTSRALISGQYDFDNLAWRPKSSDLAALRGEKKKGFAQRENSLVILRGIGTSPTAPAIYSLDKKDTVISEFSPPRWSRDGSRVFFGVKEQETEPEPSTEPKANVDVWHWKDDDVQSVQIVQLNQLRRATIPAVYDVASNKGMLLGDRALRTATPTPDGKWAIGRVDTAYSGAVEWGGSKGDYYRIDLATGQRRLIERGLTRTMGVSPDSRWYLFLKDKQVRAYDIENNKTVTLTVPGVSFLDMTDDYPYEKPIYGVAGWTRDGRVLLNHQFDIWAVPLDGSKATNLTGGVGTAEQIRFRIVNFTAAQGGGRGGFAAAAPDTADARIDMAKPLTLSAYGEWTKKSGYYSLAPGGKPTPIIYEEKSIGGVSKAANADRIIFTEQTAAEFPDYWTSNTSFASPRKVTDANPFIAEFEWTPKRVLVDYKNAKGERLQGTLTLPANYEQGKKYPMLVYFYDRMSNTHNQFSMPVYDDRPHMSTYASDGYLVLQPDIVYETGKPGTSALDCITAAVKKVIDLGYADPKHIGLQGHSWGGYQSSFILTQTDLFAAVVTGAPPTNLTSFYDETYPGSGTLQQGIMEVGQVRMGEGNTPWTARALYDSQSPIEHVRNIKTPFMILHGTADNAVDWHQGLEFYAAARRWGKQVILLSYPGEPHHLARKENQKDFQLRMKAFFDHYLKGTPAPSWMTDGVPQVKKGR
jgi:dipeptidyl aminopeptidase/acylaminoacyl peptidase